MGIVRTTAYPSRYADEERMEEGDVQNMEPLAGKFSMCCDVMKVGWKGRLAGVQRQQALAEVLALATGSAMSYQRQGRYYEVGGWTICANGSGGSVSLGTGTFGLDEAEKVSRALDALQEAGYAPAEIVTVYFTPAVYDLKLVLNLCNIIEVRNELIVQALGLYGDIQIIVSDDPAFGIPLSAFCFETVEACLYLLRQASLLAASTGKARIKPCDGSNPKFQMRSWLLRLGFIGEEYARPRATLLRNLDGDAAFFSTDSKQKAAIKRKARRLAM